MTALNPVFTVGWQLDEALKYHTRLNKRQRTDRALEMLDKVEMPNPKRRLREYPHQLSGGMRQRVLIAIALCCEPEILIADEPTTALDVTIQGQILRLMEDLKSKTGAAIILITHDLGVVAQTGDRVLVMYAGRIVEAAPVRDIFHRPQHPYTQALLKSVPKAGTGHGERLESIEGIVPSLHSLPRGCRFHDRCPYREDRCEAEEPQLQATDDLRSVRCFFPVSQ
jgi:oligopeptide/dipeptide ABC transporter ATP-binding protein